MIYKVILTEESEKNLKRLDRLIQKRIIEKLEYLARNPLHLERTFFAPKDLGGLCKYRVGDWRILILVNHRDNIMTVYDVGHRSKIYKKL